MHEASGGSWRRSNSSSSISTQPLGIRGASTAYAATGNVSRKTPRLSSRRWRLTSPNSLWVPRTLFDACPRELERVHLSVHARASTRLRRLGKGGEAHRVRAE